MRCSRTGAMGSPISGGDRGRCMGRPPTVRSSPVGGSPAFAPACFRGRRYGGAKAAQAGLAADTKRLRLEPHGSPTWPTRPHRRSTWRAPTREVSEANAASTSPRRLKPYRFPPTRRHSDRRAEDSTANVRHIAAAESGRGTSQEFEPNAFGDWGACSVLLVQRGSPTNARAR